MKAAVYTQYGSPEVLKIMDIDKPSPKPNEVLIKVYASTVNRTDTGFRSAIYVISRLFSGLFKPKLQVLGSEFSGIIEEVGTEVTLFSVGQKVFGFNDATFGAYAEYLVLNEKSTMATVPNNIDLHEAAAILEGSHYALCDIKAAKVRAGQKILVNGATGAIGSSAIQILKSMGTEITAVCATQYQELAKNLGAHKVIDYMKEDFTKINEEFDLVFDAVGKSSFSKCKPILKKDGIYISTELGKNSANIFLALFTPWFSNKKVLFPLPTINMEDVNYIKKLVENNEFKPVIDRTYKLDQVVEAHTYVDSGQKIGNVILKIN
jgi:NADPH:quinone reductase-like Zn-dependent oxidoreductase